MPLVPVWVVAVYLASIWLYTENLSVCVLDVLTSGCVIGIHFICVCVRRIHLRNGFSLVCIWVMVCTLAYIRVMALTLASVLVMAVSFAFISMIEISLASIWVMLLSFACILVIAVSFAFTSAMVICWCSWWVITDFFQPPNWLFTWHPSEQLLLLWQRFEWWLRL